MLARSYENQQRDSFISIVDKIFLHGYHSNVREFRKRNGEGFRMTGKGFGEGDVFVFVDFSHKGIIALL